jgi:hypothetical protein
LKPKVDIIDDKYLIGSSGINIMTVMACLDHCKTDHTVAPARDAPEGRVKKVLSVRRQLGEKRYGLAEKLNVVVDRLLEDLLQHDCPEESSQK